MFKFLSDAMMSMLVEKPARDKLKAHRQAAKKAATTSSRQRDMAALQEQVRGVMTPERQELIRQAMQVQRAKQQIMADLKDEDRRRLYALAVKKLLHENDKDGND